MGIRFCKKCNRLKRQIYLGKKPLSEKELKVFSTSSRNIGYLMDMESDDLFDSRPTLWECKTCHTVNEL